MNTREFARKIRKHVVVMSNRGGCSHVGSALSIADIIAVLYGKVLKVYPDRPDHPERSRFILSKGHAGTAVYAALAELGFFSKEKLKTHCQNGSDLSGHISHKGIPGVEVSTGSLGHGLNIGVGMALGAKMDDKHFQVVVLLSDGECDEGSNWEAIMFAAHHKLDNICAIVDYNKIQSLATTSETIELEPFVEKWRSFGWSVREVDGHQHDQLQEAFAKMPFEIGKPSVVIAHTIKGKGISFMENTVLWHYRCPRDEEFEAALKELEAGS
jgi:transketolase